MTPRQIWLLLKRQRQRDLRADLRAGIVASTLANIHRAENQRPFEPQDFMPLRPEERSQRSQTVAQHVDILRMIAEAQNSTN
jgi:hypothetical protein